jgi:PPK2 family polyphosphate:nucleotide phosphotransferase
MILSAMNFALPTAASGRRDEIPGQKHIDRYTEAVSDDDPSAAFKAAKKLMQQAREAYLQAAARQISVKTEQYRVKQGSTIDLNDIDPGKTPGIPHDDDLMEAIELLTKQNLKRIDELQEALYAEHKHKVLFVFQAMDTGGKDGSIATLDDGMNAQGVKVSSFKAPTSEETDHDFLWRVHEHVPGKGMIGIFNRSHYEDVLWPRVHDKIDADTVDNRIKHIKNFEELLSDEGTTVVKFFLHISKDEQLERLQDRKDEPDKNWKLSPADVAEREFWDDYQEAYSDAISRTSTARCPWYVVPANDKKIRDLIISTIALEAMENLKIGPPPSNVDVSKLKLR